MKNSLLRKMMRSIRYDNFKLPFLKCMQCVAFLSVVFSFLNPFGFTECFAQKAYEVSEFTVKMKNLDGLFANQNLQFEVSKRGNSKKTVTSKDLAITHTKIMHVLVFDESLTQFFHLHPTESKGLWTTDKIKFKHAGKYKLWVDGKLKNAKKWKVEEPEFTSFAEFEVPEKQLGRPERTAFEKPLPKAAIFPNEFKAQVGNSVVEIEGLSSVISETEIMPMLRLSRADGTKLEIAPYLGALAHVVIVPIHGKNLLHVHPMEGKKQNELMLHTEFPEKGFYRIWVQFVDNLELKTAALSVEVK